MRIVTNVIALQVFELRYIVMRNDDFLELLSKRLMYKVSMLANWNWGPVRIFLKNFVMKCQIPRLLLGLKKFDATPGRWQVLTNGHQWSPMHSRPWNISWRLRILIKSVTSYWHWRLLADVGMDGWMVGWLDGWMSFLFIASPGTFQNICSHWTCIPGNYHEYDRHLPSQGDDGCCSCCFDSGRAVESNPTTRSATWEARGVPLWVTRCGWICESSS